MNKKMLLYCVVLFNSAECRRKPGIIPIAAFPTILDMIKMIEKKIAFAGNYWWDDLENVTSLIEKEIKDILSTTRIGTIEITGTDFNDGREAHRITIDVSDNKIVIRKNGPLR